MSKTDSDQSSHLFLVSTPLHLLVTLSIVSHEQLNNVHLIFIDQVSGKKNHYFDILKQWKDSPFLSIDIFFRPQKSPLKKLKQRRQTFSDLAVLCQRFQSQHIYVGNDRRIEFQWCMHQMQAMGKPATGYYLDEGTFTYVGRPASFTWSDQYIDNALKKISYGLWWKHPPTVGASDWISTVYASYPAIVHPLLAKKNIKELSLDYWHSPALLEFCQLLLLALAKGVDFNHYDEVYTLPHESVIEANHNYKQQVYALIEQACLEGKRVAVKYHPRDLQHDALGVLGIKGTDLLPAAIPFEAMLPLLKSKITIIGDFSSALISTKILRPDLIAMAIDQPNANNKAAFLDLYQRLGIELLAINGK